MFAVLVYNFKENINISFIGSDNALMSTVVNRICHEKRLTWNYIYSPLNPILYIPVRVCLEHSILLSHFLRKAWNLGFFLSQSWICSFVRSKKLTKGGYAFRRSPAQSVYKSKSESKPKPKLKPKYRNRNLKGKRGGWTP